MTKARLVMATQVANAGARRTSAEKRSGPPAAATRKSRPTKTPPSPVPVPLGRAGTAVREGIAGSLTALTKIEGKMVVLVRAAVSSALGAAGTVTDELVLVVPDVVTGAMQATEQVGTGLVTSAKSIAKGVVLGVDEGGGDIAKAVAETVRTVVKHATAVGADVSSCVVSTTWWARTRTSAPSCARGRSLRPGRPARRFAKSPGRLPKLLRRRPSNGLQGRRRRNSLFVITDRVTSRRWPPSAFGGADRLSDTLRAAARGDFA